MYVEGNPLTKKELKSWVADPTRSVRLFAPGLGTPEVNGTETVQGPHAPRPHSWYARVLVRDGRVIKVLG